MKTFLIDKELESGVVVSEEGHRFSFDKDDKTIYLMGSTIRFCIPFLEIREYADTLNALVFALREDIEEAIEEAQDNSLPE